jgi:hypothetical protein
LTVYKLLADTAYHYITGGAPALPNGLLVRYGFAERRRLFCFTMLFDSRVRLLYDELFAAGRPMWISTNQVACLRMVNEVFPPT